MTETQTAAHPAVGLRQSLDDLAKVIKTEVAAIAAAENSIANAEKSITLHAIKAGGALNDAKGRVKHGEWKSWLKDNFDMSERTAQRYMLLASERPKLEQAVKAKSAEAKAKFKSATVADLTVADLTLNQAVRIVSPPDDSNPSDKYDQAEEKLIARLLELSPEEAEAAVNDTTKKLRKTVATMTKAATPKAA